LKIPIWESANPEKNFETNTEAESNGLLNPDLRILELRKKLRNIALTLAIPLLTYTAFTVNCCDLLPFPRLIHYDIHSAFSWTNRLDTVP